jgi:hypothetical protein
LSNNVDQKQPFPRKSGNSQQQVLMLVLVLVLQHLAGDHLANHSLSLLSNP